MKNIFALLLSACLCFLHANAQKKDKKDAPPVAAVNAQIAEPEVDIYNTALKYGDYAEAKTAIYWLMQKHPGVNSYLDSLAQLYFAMGEYAQCILSGTDYLQKDTANANGVMQLMAISQGSLNRYKEALELWDKLWKQSGNCNYAYQIAINQYLLKRYGECAQTIDIILKDPAADKEQVNISIDQTHSQKVAMKAAAHNLMGVIQKELSMPDKAKDSFEAALKLSPDFELAKSNLDEMNKKDKDDAAKDDSKPKAPTAKKKGQ